MSVQKKRSTAPACAECGARCCRYVATQIDKPTCKRDYDNIRWYLLHGDISVFVDNSGDWYLEFKSDCLALGQDLRCRNYDKRPLICREHGETRNPCEFHSREGTHLIEFHSAAEFEKYLDGRGIDWRWKRLK